MNRINQLDGLRGICALMLVFFHFGHRDTILTSNFLIRRSDLFVDFFFVLSGFVISLNYYQRDSNFSKARLVGFLKKRLIRLYPLLFYTITVYLIYEIFLKFFVNQKNPKPFDSLLLQSLDSLTFLNSTSLLGTTNGLNYPSWSISAEMISYFTFGILMLIHKRFRIALSISLILGAVIFVFYKNEYLFMGNFGFVRGIYCFLIGFFTLVYYQTKQREMHFLEVPILALMTISFYWSYSNQDNELPLLIMPWVFGLMIYIFSNSKGYISNLLKSRYCQRLGTISYSIYLNHAIVLSATHLIWFGLFDIPKTEIFILLNLLLVVIITIAYSEITYRLIERKLGNRLKKILNVKRNGEEK